MIPDQVLEQLASASFDKAQVIVVMKMLMVTAEAARAQVRQEMREELAGMRADYGRLIIEAVEATEGKIFARLEEERQAEAEKKRLRRERAAARKREREAAKVAAPQPARAMETAQTGMFVDAQGGEDVREEQEGSFGLSVSSSHGQSMGAHLAPMDELSPKEKELIKFWEDRQKQGETQTKPIGSAMAAMQSLGEAMLASWKKQEGSSGSEIAGMIAQEGYQDEGQAVDDVMMEAAE